MNSFIKGSSYLRVCDDTDELAVADHLLEGVLNRLLAQIVGPLLRGLGESLLLARVPSRNKNIHITTHLSGGGVPAIQCDSRMVY